MVSKRDLFTANIDEHLFVKEKDFDFYDYLVEHFGINNYKVLKHSESEIIVSTDGFKHCIKLTLVNAWMSYVKIEAAAVLFVNGEWQEPDWLF